MIELLDEQTVIINRAVTGGQLNVTHSGEWWRVPGIGGYRYARYHVQLGKMLDAKRITGYYLAPYLRNTDVQWDNINVDDLPKMDFHPSERGRFGLQSGDVLVCEGGEVGRAAQWNGELDCCFYQKALHRLRAFGQLDYPRFLLYVFFAAAKRGVFYADSSLNTIGHLTAVKLRRTRFAFPSRDEQQQIADWLDQATCVMVPYASRRNAFAGTAALISNVVTGNVDVCGPRGNGSLGPTTDKRKSCRDSRLAHQRTALRAIGTTTANIVDIAKLLGFFE